MTDADRLREAARALDGSCGDRYAERSAHRTAELLRALADAVWITTEVTSSASSPPVWEWGPGPAHAAALALADTIIGGRDD